MNLTSSRVSAAAAKTFGHQKPISKTEILFETDDYVFSVYDNNNSKKYRIANKKNQPFRKQDLLLSDNYAIAKKQWDSLITTGEMKRI